MPLRDSEAIVLRSFPLGEADRLVSLLTRSAGRLRGVARGARRPRSRFGAALEALSHIRVWFYEREGRELVRISQCELLESFLEAQRNYDAGLALALVSEVSEAVLPEHEASDPAFRLLLVTARTVQQLARDGARSFALPVSYFLLWTVRLAGWLPELSRCSRCGRELGDEPVWLSAGSSGAACDQCRAKAAGPGMRPLPARSLAVARRMLETRLERLAGEQPPLVPGAGLDQYLLDVIEHHIERGLTTRRMLEAVP